MSTRKIKWGILGTATIAKNHTIPGMAEAVNCELYAIAGRNSEKVEEFQKNFGFQKAYLSYDELLDDPEIEAVYIPLPNQLHKEWVLKAAKKKKHILCEKPLSGTYADTHEMIEACEKEGVLLMEAFAYLHSNAIEEVIKKVQNHVIGKPVLIEAAFVVKKWDAANIRMRKETFGGTTYDQGCYMISLLLKMLEEMPDTVKGIGDFMENGVDDYSTLYLKFPSGCRAVLLSALCSGQRGDRCVIYGTDGILESRIPFNAKGTVEYLIIKDGKTERFQIKVPSNYKLEVEQFGRCILNEETPFVSNELSLKIATVMDCAQSAITIKS